MECANAKKDLKGILGQEEDVFQKMFVLNQNHVHQIKNVLMVPVLKDVVIINVELMQSVMNILKDVFVYLISWEMQKFYVHHH